MNLERPKKTNEDFAEEEKEILKGEITPADRLQNQMRLATLLYGTLHNNKFDVESGAGRNEIMFFWTKKSDGKMSYSEAYREIENNEGFNDHSRFQGDIYNITIDDVVYFRENETLPEE